MSTLELAELVAPPGTYEYFRTSLGYLGNYRTKRYIIVYKQLVDVLGLSVRVRNFREGTEQHTLFLISSKDEVLGVFAHSFENETSWSLEVSPPTLAESLREVKIAKRYQPRLRNL